MYNEKGLLQELKSSAFWTAFLTLLLLMFYRTENSISDILIVLPFFIVLYYFFFSIGKEKVSARMRTWIDSDVRKMIIFPVLLMSFYFFYVLLTKQNPFYGTLALLPYLIFFPILMFVVCRQKVQQINWIDFTSFMLCLVLVSFIKVNPVGNLPFNGEGFDSVYRIIIMLNAVYVFSIIRGLDDVGFFPVFKWKFLWIAMWVWFVFYLIVVIVGYSVDFVKFIGHKSVTILFLNKIVITLIATFFHTAIYEELFFRGILQNMLSKRIGQTGSWKIFWKWGLLVLLPLALLVGYTLRGNMKWFPALMTLIIFAVAFFIERANKNKTGVFTGLAITSVIFGLVHYHSGAIIYIGFACLAGWAYGYTYIKTRNVFYSALVHTLVNSSVLIFGLEYMM
jgi:membrane protease YdiL (CAAX protease family)